MRDTPPPYWPAVTDETLREPASLARALAAMGFAAAEPCGTRDTHAEWWPPAYARGPAARRHGFGALNRSIRDAGVIAARKPDLFTLIDTRNGEWTTPTGAARGDDLLSLGALMWRVTPGQAAFRIARAIGLTVPKAIAVTAADVWREVRDRMQQEPRHAG